MNTTQGRRLPDATNLKGALFQPGDYQKVTFNDNFDQRVEWFCLPVRGMLGALGSHEVTEHEDGTITVSPSILIESNDPKQAWHGYLEHGVWREV